MEKIAYIMSRFPMLTETFILREMSALQSLGWDIELFPIVIQKREKYTHAEAKAWLSRAKASNIFVILSANLGFLLASPKKYLKLLFRVIKGNISSLKFTIRAVYLYPRAVWMAKTMQNSAVKHVHAHYATYPALAAWIIYHLTGIPYSVTVHAHDIFVDKTMLAEKIKDAKAVVAISEFNRQYLARYLGEEILDKVFVIHCGIELARYKQHEKEKKIRNEIFNIISIGSLQPYKGFSCLLKACFILKNNGFPFHCSIVGGGELRKELELEIDRLGLNGYVELLGPKTQDEVARLLGSSDCYVQPSIITSSGKMEGIPVAIMEAMASELPVVASKLSGIPELVQDDMTGLLVEPEDPKALADALVKVHDTPLFVEKIARNGKAHVLSEFDLHKNVLDLSNLLSGLIR